MAEQMETPQCPTNLPADPFSEKESIEKNSDFLLTCMVENLNQARHVEMERIMFVTLFSALVIGALGVAKSEDKFVSLILLAISILLNILCICLVSRWNSVFSEHRRVAKEIYLRLCYPEHFPGLSAELSAEDADKYPAINKFYHFENKLKAKRPRFYLRTGRLFLTYNMLILGLLVFYLFHIL